jgi:hypothetical protein
MDIVLNSTQIARAWGSLFCMLLVRASQSAKRFLRFARGALVVVYLMLVTSLFECLNLNTASGAIPIRKEWLAPQTGERLVAAR